MLEENGYLLRIYVGERCKHQGKALFEWIVRRAKEEKLQGATVLRAMEGFGSHGEIHSAKILDMSTDLPIVIEIVDELEKIQSFLSHIEPAIQDGLATIEKVHMRFYRKAKD